MYNVQCEVDVDMLNAVKSVLADVSGISPLSEQKANNYVTFSETVTRCRNDLKLNVFSPVQSIVSNTPFFLEQSQNGMIYQIL